MKVVESLTKDHWSQNYVDLKHASFTPKVHSPLSLLTGLLKDLYILSTSSFSYFIHSNILQPSF